jgi:hypothetical protein
VIRDDVGALPCQKALFDTVGHMVISETSCIRSGVWRPPVSEVGSEAVGHKTTSNPPDLMRGDDELLQGLTP